MRFKSIIWPALLMVPLTLFCSQFTGKVVSVIDGDTIEVLYNKNPIKIRLDGIDCPESGQAFGKKAKQATSEMSFGIQVEVNSLGTDRYGRTLAKIKLPNKTCLNEELLKRGLAWHYKKYNSETLYESLENAARKNKIGLWSEANPIPPWEFRNGGASSSSLSVTKGYIGSKNSDKFHVPTCIWAMKIKSHNLVVFNTRNDAISAGYVPCKVCHP
jgi:micrococcal nuclease